MSEIPRGRFTWHQLNTADPEAAKAFYTAITGWTTSVWEGADGPYTMWMNGETSLGGIMQMPEEAAAQGTPPHWLAYVASPDVDATAARAAELGGRVMVPPMDIPEVGRFTVLQDPQGAVFAAFTPEGEAPGHDGPPEVGEFSWHELITTDREAAFGFYSDLFGWKTLEAMDMGEAGIYQLYGRTDLPLGGMFNKTEDMPMPPAWIVYVRVPDVHAGAEKVKEKGGQVVVGPMEVPGGDWIVQCTDPQGGFFALHHRAAG